MKMKNVSQAKAVENFPGVVRRTLSYNDEAMLCHFTLKKGAGLPLHKHRATQIGFILRGKTRFLAEKPEDEFEAEAGKDTDSYGYRKVTLEFNNGKKQLIGSQKPSQTNASVPFWVKYGLVGLLLVAYFVMALSSVVNKCTTFDEIAHLTAGYSYWLDNDYRLTPEGGNLSQRWFALPLLFGGYQLPSRNQDSWWKSDPWAFGRQFFYGQGNDLEAMLLAGRVMAILLGVALCLLIYHWSSSLFGHIGGLISLTLCVFSPSLLANGRLMTVDLPASLFFLLFLWRFWIVLHRITPWTILWSCLAAAGLVLTKMSGTLAIPMAVVLIAIRLLSKEPLTVTIHRAREIQGRWRWLGALGVAALLHVFVCFLAIWAFSGFRYSAMNQAIEGRDQLPVPWEQMMLDDPGPVTSIINFARHNRLLPEGYLWGFACVVKLSGSVPHETFLNGEVSVRGWRSFFIYCLIYKTPLSVFLILGISLAATVKSWLCGSAASKHRIYHSWFASFYRTAPLWALLAIYWAFAINSKLNIGHRHILPTYPPMFILAGAAAFWFKQKNASALAIKALTMLALLGFVLESLLIWPNYLAYFNQLAGGPKNGYRHLVDSSLDWGQDLPGLKRWLDRHKDESPVYLSYFGTGDPNYYGIPAKLLASRFDWNERNLAMALTGGTYCISATRLQLPSPVLKPWTTSHENQYRKLLDLVIRYNRATNGKAGPPQTVLGQDAAWWKDVFLKYDYFRFTRLTVFLCQREPDDSVGYSILIYRLSDEDIDQALFGTPALTR